MIQKIVWGWGRGKEGCLLPTGEKQNRANHVPHSSGERSDYIDDDISFTQTLTDELEQPVGRPTIPSKGSNVSRWEERPKRYETQARPQIIRQ